MLQCLLATLFMSAVLIALGTQAKDALLGAIGASSLGSSFCTVFIVPDSVMTRPRNVLGGYAVGLTMGALCYYFSVFSIWLFPHLPHMVNEVLFTSLAVGLSLMTMVAVDLEHPPAAGLAIGLVLEPWDQASLIVIIASVIVLSILKRLLRPYLISLL